MESNLSTIDGIDGIDEIDEIDEIDGIDELHKQYRQHLEDFGKYLKNDWKRWSIMQIKQAMIQGQNSMYLFNMGKKDWKKAKNISNFWKPIPEEDLKYYHKQTNVIVTSGWLRTVIDYLGDIDIEWMPVATQSTESLTLNFNQIHAIIKYPLVTAKVKVEI